MSDKTRTNRFHIFYPTADDTLRVGRQCLICNNPVTIMVLDSLKENISIPLLLIIIILTSIGLVPLHNLQSSYAGTENDEIQTGSNASETSNEQQQRGEEQGSADDTQSAEEPNATSTAPGPDTVTTTPSDLLPDNGNQTTTTTSNQTEETSKPRMFERQLSPDVLKDLQILTPSPPYTVRVVFDSMTVHNDHEGAFSGDGEYDIAAYVQGIKVGLTDASGPGDGLWDVSSGETVTFDPGTEVTVDIPTTIPLSVLTVGSEVDGCDRTSFPASIQNKIAELVANSPVGAVILVSQLASTMDGVQDRINSAINWVGCNLNPNDIIGVINKAYEPTAYGAGQHAEKSDKGDFTLRYSIDVTAPPPPQNQQQSGLQTNKFTGQLDKQLTLEKPNSTSEFLSK